MLQMKLAIWVWFSALNAIPHPVTAYDGPSLRVQKACSVRVWDGPPLGLNREGSRLRLAAYPETKGTSRSMALNWIFPLAPLSLS